MNGLVNASPGNRGGYTLNTVPSKITVGSIVRLLKKNSTSVACVEDPATCHRSSKCVSRRVWIQLDEAISGVIDAITLADMIEMHNDLTS
jgi:Rrf2 family protein